MYLKELTINGFKSFAKKSELEFSAPITSIVGPNGSGKSNVAEAFRFVLGEQSVKSLRGKRGEDLIWGGSEAVSRGNRASVSVLIDNTKRVFALDFDEIKIERTVHRDGQNEYFINDSQVRLKDVQELLAAANIGSTGHHIISQGEADRILSASSKERREMLEDALGLKVYQYKKNEAEKKLTKTEENIEQVQSLRREHAPHLKYLKKQVERVEKSLAVQAELKVVYGEYLKREDIYIAYHTDRLQAERRVPAEQLSEVQHKLDRAKKILRDAESQKDSSHLLEAESALSTARRDRQIVLKTLSQIEGQISYIEHRIKQKQTQVQSTDTQVIPLSTLTDLIRRIESDVEKSLGKDEPALLKRALTDVVHALRAFIAKTEPTELQDTENEESELKQLLHTRREQETLYKHGENAEEKAQAAYNAIKNSIEAEVTESHEAERAVFTLVGEQRTLEMAIERIDRELSVLERDRQEFKRELQEAVALIQSAAAHYFKFDIVADGVSVSNKDIVSEERSAQYERRRQLEKLKIRLEELGLGATDEVVKEYQNAIERDDFLAREISDLETSVAKLQALITELNSELHQQFIVGIEKITIEFNRFFALMFGGGKAELKRVKPKIKRVADDGTEVEEDDEQESS